MEVYLERLNRRSIFKEQGVVNIKVELNKITGSRFFFFFFTQSDVFRLLNGDYTTSCFILIAFINIAHLSCMFPSVDKRTISNKNIYLV